MKMWRKRRLEFEEKMMFLSAKKWGEVDVSGGLMRTSHNPADGKGNAWVMRSAEVNNVRVSPSIWTTKGHS